jgi:hypothetical protein
MNHEKYFFHITKAAKTGPVDFNTHDKQRDPLFSPWRFLGNICLDRRARKSLSSKAVVLEADL